MNGIFDLTIVGNISIWEEHIFECASCISAVLISSPKLPKHSVFFRIFTRFLKFLQVTSSDGQYERKVHCIVIADWNSRELPDDHDHDDDEVQN